MLATAEGLPVHIFGSHLQTRAMTDLHADIAEGDAFLHNDPYLGNTHPADHAVLVPVFIDGEHLFTACAKGHQADIGNSIPTTYHAAAKDVYEEGSLIFPCVRVQRDYAMVDDVIRMCRRRIRVPEQWYGDFLAELGAARIAERRLKELCAKYGTETVKTFIREWFDYSERRMVQAIGELPKAEVEARGAHDPFEPFLPEGIPIKVALRIDPDEGRVTIDLRDNIDCVDCGLNQSEACAINNVVAGLFNCLGPEIPHNGGSFRRVDVRLRDGCVVGRPSFPHSTSMATTNVADRLVNITHSAMARLGDGYGLAEGGSAMGSGGAVLSGKDFRRGGDPYINQLMMLVNGGPAGPQADGWVTYVLPVVSGLMYRDSIELAEVKHPMLFQDGAAHAQHRRRRAPSRRPRLRGRLRAARGPDDRGDPVGLPDQPGARRPGRPRRHARGPVQGRRQRRRDPAAQRGPARSAAGRDDPRPRRRRRRLRRPDGAGSRARAHGCRARLGDTRPRPRGLWRGAQRRPRERHAGSRPGGDGGAAGRRNLTISRAVAGRRSYRLALARHPC